MASASWSDRNARAQALGYRNYYDYRAHGYGSRPADMAPLTGSALARARGHAAGADLARVLDSGQVELVNVVEPRAGTYEVLVTKSDGSQATYQVKGEAQLAKVQASIGALGPDAPQFSGSDETIADLAGDMEEAYAEQAEFDDEEFEDEDLEDFGDDDIPF